MRKSNTGLVVVLSVLGSLLLIAVFATAALFSIRAVNVQRDAAKAAYSSSQTATTNADATTTDPDTTITDTPTTTETTTTETTTTTATLYGGIAYSGSRAYVTKVNETDGFAAKAAAIAECNQSIWNAGWSSDSYCGYVPVTTGQCASVATANAASGWGPTGWQYGPQTRAVTRQGAIDRCNQQGQGQCYELITLCM